ncbi:condensation domain-containing protein, partial [Streptomyces sp. NPDC017890]|uniref:condensation domain-containing protein n=1 Tax=Streptomyces sp. NPDC017890 TaxID=3365015 RepID=UPI0037A0F690
DGVADAVVLVHQAPSGARHLTGYVVPEPGRDLDTGRLRTLAAERLPEYALPGTLLVLDELPLTRHGKLDRAALPVPHPEEAGRGREPRTEREALLCDLFADVLGVERVGADDGFFALGGDSIMSIQLVSRARRAGLVLTPRDVFEHRTPAALAGVCRTAGGETADAVEDDGTGPVEPTPVMRWLRDWRGTVEGFQQSVLLQVPAGLGEERLTAAVQALLDHHDALRLRVPADADGVLEVGGPGSVDAGRCVRRVPSADADVVAEARAAVARLAPESGVMLQAVWFDAGPEDFGRLLVVAHHFAVDGVSWRILLPDLRQAWEAVAAGEPVRLDPVGTSFRRWAALLTERAQDPALRAELPYWTDGAGADEPALGRRPLDRSRDTTATARHLTVTLPRTRTAPLLSSVPAAFHGGVNDVLLGALALAVRQWRAARGADAAGGVLIDLEGHGRDGDRVGAHADLSRTVGWFTRVHPVRLDVTVCGDDPADAVKRVKEQLRAVPGDGFGHGLLRHLNTDTADILAALPEPQIGFNYLGRTASVSSSASSASPGSPADWTPLDRPGGLEGLTTPLPHALEINAIAKDGPEGPVLSATFAWAGGLLDEAEVRELAERWLRALETLADVHTGTGTGGHTPSDFPLVPALTQEQVETLEAAYPGLEDVLPLSPLQEGLLFHAHYDHEGTDVYTAQVELDLGGRLDEARLREAWTALLRRHANLRAAFVPDTAGVPVQVIVRDPDMPWRTVDLRALPEADAEAEAGRIAAEERGRRLDPARAPLMRLTLLRLDDTRQRLVLTNHHILFDGWSVPVLAKELFTLYAGGAGAELPPPTPYGDYLAWLAAQDGPAAERAWADALDGVEEPTLLVPDAPTGTAGAPGVPARIGADLPAPAVAALRRLARDRGLTVNTLVQGAWALLLSRLTGRDDVVFGTTVSGRPPEIPGIESMVGLFINTLPVRVVLDPAEGLADLLLRVQDAQSKLMAHQHVGLSRVTRLSGLPRLFDSLVVFENYPVAEGTVPASGLAVGGTKVHDATHYPVTLAAGLRDDDRLWLRLHYMPRLLTEEAAHTLTGRFLALLRTLADDPARPSGTVEVLTAEERHRILTDWNDVDADSVRPATSVVEAFAAQVARTPEAVAVRWDGGVRTYRELDERADRLAARLLSLGVVPEERVALLMERSPDIVTAVLGVLKAGAVYVPLDGRLPEARLASMTRLAGCRVVVTDGSTAADRLPGVAHEVVAGDGDRPEEAAVQAPAPRVLPDSAAYVMFTSGSTGEPKGVEITHRGVVSLATDRRWSTGAASGGDARPHRVLLHSPYGFDPSTYELWMPLLGGGEVVVAPPGDLDVPTIARTLRAHGVTSLLLTAGLFRVVAEEDPGCLAGVREVLTGGDVVSSASVRRVLHACPDTVVTDIYGPTEITLFATQHSLRDAARVPGSVPVGRARDGMRAYVLDGRLRPVPPGAPGELYIAG